MLARGILCQKHIGPASQVGNDVNPQQGCFANKLGAFAGCERAAMHRSRADPRVAESTWHNLRKTETLQAGLALGSW